MVSFKGFTILALVLRSIPVVPTTFLVESSMFKLKDIVIIGTVLVLLSPVIYFVMLLLTNNARIEFGKPDNGKQSATEEVIRTIKSSPAKDSMVAKYSRSYQAYEIQRREITDEEARIADEKNRLEILKSEIEKE